MGYFDQISAGLIGDAQEAYVRELSQHFLMSFKDVTYTMGAKEAANLQVLARIARTEAIRIFGNWRERVDANCKRVFAEALTRVDDKLVGDFIRYVGDRPHNTNLAKIIAAQAAQGMSEILYRQNIAMAEEQARIWYEVTAEAITRSQLGEGYKDVMERGVKRLAEEGLATIDYVSGRKTSIDAALRRHIVTQANQARNRLLMQRMDEWEWDLVFVSAHFGARPSHALWQGKVYSRSGTSDKYPPLVEETGYGTVTGLCGANCRHTMTPYVEGLSKLPDTDWTEQEKLVGQTSEEYYQATQRQRVLERHIRATRREKAALDLLNLDSMKQSVKLAEQYKKMRTLVAEHHLRRDYLRERPWGITYKFTQSGALWKKKGEEYERQMEAHAEKFYAAMRKRNIKREAQIIAKNVKEFTAEEVEKILNHVFIKKHDLYHGYTYFDPSFDMSVSFQMLREGKNIREADIIMLHHELYELTLMEEQGLSYDEAHDETNLIYNYAQAMKDLRKKIKDG